jgi:hypothetical protein
VLLFGFNVFFFSSQFSFARRFGDDDGGGRRIFELNSKLREKLFKIVFWKEEREREREKENLFRDFSQIIQFLFYPFFRNLVHFSIHQNNPHTKNTSLFISTRFCFL